MKPFTDEEFVSAVAAEIERARAKFPNSDAINCALVEEVREVSTALMYEPWQAVFNEAVQVAAMAQRLAVEGDGTMAGFRFHHVHENGQRYGLLEHKMPERQK